MPDPVSRPTIGTPFIELQSVDSTNNYARSLIKEAAAGHGTAIFAHEQWAGKGQMGKHWSSEPGANIILSIVVKPGPLMLTQQFALSACVAVSVHQFFMKHAGDETSIKWPNDLYWQDRKAGGVLIESGVKSSESGVSQSTVRSRQSDSNWQWAIVGIGINVNQTRFPSGLPNPVSLQQITGKKFDAVALARECCGVLDQNFDELLNNGFDKIYNYYNNHLYKKNQVVRFRKANRVFEAIVEKVSLMGKLVVKNSLEEEFDFGQVEWMS